MFAETLILVAVSKDFAGHALMTPLTLEEAPPLLGKREKTFNDQGRNLGKQCILLPRFLGVHWGPWLTYMMVA